MPKPRPLALERLEDRLTPVTWGNPWPDGAHLTLSFAPDGTPVGGLVSNLHRELGTTAPTATWQREILRAFQTWAMNANVNFGRVPDGGQALGSAGRPQGDARFGDVRLAGYRMSPEVLAITTPFDPTGGTWAGDVRLNTGYQFGTGPGQVDLFTALLQEAGHALGIGNSADPASAMYEFYQGPRAGLSAADVAAVHALYGARQHDGFEGSAGNGTFGAATRLGLLKDSDGALGVQADADLTSLGDRDFYRVQAPLTLGGFAVRVRTVGLSLLAPRVTVYDSYQRVVGSAVSSGPLGGDLVVNVARYNPLASYYIKVESGTGDVFGVGSYRLEVKALPLVGSLLGSLTSTVETASSTLLANDLHTNDTFLTASLLPALTQTSSRFDYAFKGSVSDRYDVDFYRVVAPTAPAGQPNVMTVMTWGTENGGLAPRATVYDAFGREVAADVLVNENGIYTLQVVGAVAGASYFVKVEAGGAGGGTIGNYFLGIDYGTRSVDLRTLSRGELSGSRPAAEGSMQVNATALFHFVLSAEGAGAPAGSGVRLTILDSTGTAVGGLFASPGKSVSTTLLLTPGTYTFRYEVVGPAGQPLPVLTYLLRGIRLSDPIGPGTEDPTEAPAQPSGSSSNYTPPSGYYVPPDGGSSSPPSGYDTTSSTSSSPSDSSSSMPSSTESTSSDSSGDSSSPPPDTKSNYWWTYSDDSGVATEDPYSDPYTTY